MKRSVPHSKSDIGGRVKVLPDENYYGLSIQQHVLQHDKKIRRFEVNKPRRLETVSALLCYLHRSLRLYGVIRVRRTPHAYLTSFVRHVTHAAVVGGTWNLRRLINRRDQYTNENRVTKRVFA